MKAHLHSPNGKLLRNMTGAELQQYLFEAKLGLQMQWRRTKTPWRDEEDISEIEYNLENIGNPQKLYSDVRVRLKPNE